RGSTVPSAAKRGRVPPGENAVWYPWNPPKSVIQEINKRPQPRHRMPAAAFFYYTKGKERCNHEKKLRPIKGPGPGGSAAALFHCCGRLPDPGFFIPVSVFSSLKLKSGQRNPLPDRQPADLPDALPDLRHL